MLGVGQCFVFAQGELGAEEEVGKGSLVKDAVDDDLVGNGFEIEAPVGGAEAVKSDAIALHLSEAIIIEVIHVFLGDLKLVEKFKLFEGAELGYFGSGDFVEDDLEHVGDCSGGWAMGKGGFAVEVKK